MVMLKLKLSELYVMRNNFINNLLKDYFLNFIK